VTLPIFTPTENFSNPELDIFCAKVSGRFGGVFDLSSAGAGAELSLANTGVLANSGVAKAIIMIMTLALLKFNDNPQN
jgi:hypothetical protein